MKWLHDGYTLEDVYSKVKAAKDRVLLTDYDGTLAPFVYERGRAKPYPEVMTVLNEIAKADRSRVIVISGRSIQGLSRLFKLDAPVEMWGTHGWERQNEEGERTTWPISDEAREALYEVINWAENEEFSSHLEVKPASVALHWRGTDAHMREHLMDRSAKIMGSLAEKTGLELHEFDGGRELRVPGRNKGLAVERILQDVDKNTYLSYLGDDKTDEDAFGVIGTKGLRVLVRNEARDTKADLWLRPPRELLRFLEGWLAALRG
ncbi:trehalose-phosphatase [bacterium]|nr:trehalose-phosphatase [bacterium]